MLSRRDVRERCMMIDVQEGECEGQTKELEGVRVFPLSELPPAPVSSFILF